MEWITTTIVLDRLGDADPDTWELLVGRFRSPIIQLATQFGLSRDEAEDVAQETLLDFTRAYRDGQYDRSKGRLHSWLFGIAHRRVRNFVRRAERHRNQAPPGGDGDTTFFSRQPSEEDARTTWDQSWETMVLEQCMSYAQREVDPKTWRAFEMVVLQNQPIETVAADLGMSRNAIYAVKHRMLKKLRLLKEEFEAARLDT